MEGKDNHYTSNMLKCFFKIIIIVLVSWRQVMATAW